MKLLAITNRYYLITLVLVFALGSLAAYAILKSIINKEFNEKLLAEKQQLIYELHTYDDLKDTYYLNIGDVIEVEEVMEDPMLQTTLADTVMYDLYEKKELPFRVMTFSDQFNGRFYVIQIKKSLLPNQDLIEGISEIMIGLMLVLVISLGLLNRIIFRKLWAPFHQMITQLSRFNIKKPIPIHVDPNNVEEFRDLKIVLDQMINKSIRDYENLKEYTENTSHEIQTPLAIIKSKAEVLLQEPLGEAVLTDILQIYEAATRLSRLKEGLSMLSKIDNNQYLESGPINIREFVLKKLEALEEVIEMRDLEVITDFRADPLIQANGDLIFILVTNLVGNAIKHNIVSGKIRFVLEAERLVIENTGKAPLIPTDQLFDRFKRSAQVSADGSGLGLSLVKRIVEFYDMQVNYVYDQGWHRITISFGNILYSLA